MTNSPIAEIESALSDHSYVIVELIDAGQTAQTRAVTETGVEFDFTYNYQGVWDRENNTYVDLEEIDTTFDNDNWEDTGSNLIIPDQTGQYEHSYILDECQTVEGETVSTY